MPRTQPRGARDSEEPVVTQGGDIRGTVRRGEVGLGPANRTVSRGLGREWAGGGSRTRASAGLRTDRTGRKLTSVPAPQGFEQKQNKLDYFLNIQLMVLYSNVGRGESQTIVIKMKLCTESQANVTGHSGLEGSVTLGRQHPHQGVHRWCSLFRGLHKHWSPKVGAQPCPSLPHTHRGRSQVRLPPLLTVSIPVAMETAGKEGGRDSVK